MDTRELELFLHLSETLHFGRTSQAKNLSPSALTRTIQQLEDQLNTPLFVRDNRSVKLTHAGKLFQQYAKESLGQWQNFQLSLMEETQALSGIITIYCSVTASYSFLYQLLSEFRNKNPKIGIRVHTGDPEKAIQRVRDEEEDLSISAKPDIIPSTLTFKAISQSELIFIGPKDSPNYQDWASAPMILSETGLIRKRVNEWFLKQNIKPTIYAEVSGNEAIVSMVSLGFGMGVVPKIVLENSPLADKIQVISNKIPIAPIEVGLCTLKKGLQNPLIRAFWESLPE